MRISIGTDHAGFEYKEQIKDFLTEQNIDFHDYGSFSKDSVDYPDFAHPVSQDVQNQKSDLGILLCGSGNGVAMVANKYAGVRACTAWMPELAQLGRTHNDANILVIPAKFISAYIALEMVKAFLANSFEGGRHKRRVDKIARQLSDS